MPGRRSSSLTKKPPNERKSTAIVAVVLLAIAAWNLYKERMGITIGFGSVGLLLALFAAFIPAGASLFYRLWMKFAHVLAFVNTRIILFVFYFLVMTPYGALSRLFGKNPLGRRGPAQGSYWVKRENPRQPKDRFARLF
jgi:saxitoxin biosynthesis operon SxtJ-like protein